MKCGNCGVGKAFCYGTKTMKRSDGVTIVRRARLCDECGAAWYTIEVPIQEVLPKHPAVLVPGGRDRPVQTGWLNAKSPAEVISSRPSTG